MHRNSPNLQTSKYQRTSLPFSVNYCPNQTILFQALWLYKKISHYWKKDLQNAICTKSTRAKLDLVVFQVKFFRKKIWPEIRQFYSPPQINFYTSWNLQTSHFEETSYLKEKRLLRILQKNYVAGGILHCLRSIVSLSIVSLPAHLHLLKHLIRCFNKCKNASSTPMLHFSHSSACLTLCLSVSCKSLPIKNVQALLSKLCKPPHPYF